MLLVSAYICEFDPDFHRTKNCICLGLPPMLSFCFLFFLPAKRTKVYIRLSWIKVTVIPTRRLRYLEFSKGMWLGGPDQIAFVKLCRTGVINHVDVLLFWRWVGTKLKKKMRACFKAKFFRSPLKWCTDPWEVYTGKAIQFTQSLR